MVTSPCIFSCILVSVVVSSWINSDTLPFGGRKIFPITCFLTWGLSIHISIGVFRNSRSDSDKGPLRGSKGRRLGQS